MSRSKYTREMLAVSGVYVSTSSAFTPSKRPCAYSPTISRMVSSLNVSQVVGRVNAILLLFISLRSISVI